jgi:hypothetical protein
MSKKRNPTTQTQKALITLIIAVSGLFLLQIALISTQQASSTDRITCLNSGNVWSQSTGECYGQNEATADITSSSSTSTTDR